MKNIHSKLAFFLLCLLCINSFSACSKVTDMMGSKYIGCKDISGVYIMSNHNPNGVDYIVTCNLNVMSNGHLIIERGTTIQFAPNAGINVTAGRIEIKGENGHLVTLERMSDTPLASWKGIMINSFDFNEIEYAHIKGGKTSQGNAGVYFTANSNGAVKNSIIEDTGCGIFEEFLSLATVRNNTYMNVGNGHCEEF